MARNKHRPDYEELGWEILIIGDGTDVYVTFINCKATKDHCAYTTKYHMNVLLVTIYEDQTCLNHLQIALRFTHTYFQNCVREWNHLDKSIRNSQTISGFKSQLVRLVRPTKKSIFGVHDIEGVRLLTRLRVQLSDLREHRFRHRFHCSSPMCFFQKGIEDNEHFLLHYPRYTNYRKDLLDRISSIVHKDLDSLTSIDLCNLLLYGNSQFPFDTNHSIIEPTIPFIKSSRCFEQIDLHRIPF